MQFFLQGLLIPAGVFGLLLLSAVEGSAMRDLWVDECNAGQVQSCRYLLPSTAHDAVEKRLDQKGLKALAEARSNLVAKQDAVPTAYEVLINPSAANPQ